MGLIHSCKYGDVNKVLEHIKKGVDVNMTDDEHNRTPLMYASEAKQLEIVKILVENNATGMLADLIAEKTGVFIEDKNKILRYDGRPFLCDELNKEIKGRLK